MLPIDKAAGGDLDGVKRRFEGTGKARVVFIETICTDPYGYIVTC